MRRITVIAFVAIISASVLCGCGYARMSFNKSHGERWPSLSARKAANPERNFIVAGKMQLDPARRIPLAVVAVSDDLMSNELVDMYMVNAPSHYSLYLPPGTYKLVVFADLNGNMKFHRSEMVGKYGDDGKLVLVGKEGGVVTGIDIHIDLENPTDSGFRFHRRVRKRLSHISLDSITKSLGDPLFSERMGELGIYNPADFMRKVPSMLYTIEGDNNKIPVVFVHGVGGTPANWKFISSRLDRDRFHPWFFYYPSGESLEKSAEVLYWILEENFPYEQVVLVAHSMGGLVSRATLDMYARQRRSDYITTYISLSTPYNGVESAKMAVNNPVSAPSWLNIAPSSDFLFQYSQNGLVPGHVDFHLFFAYGEGFAQQCGDGTIDLQSQLPWHTQLLARGIFGFDVTHAGILTNEQVAIRLNAILKSVAAMKR